MNLKVLMRKLILIAAVAGFGLNANAGNSGKGALIKVLGYAATADNVYVGVQNTSPCFSPDGPSGSCYRMASSFGQAGLTALTAESGASTERAFNGPGGSPVPDFSGLSNDLLNSMRDLGITDPKSMSEFIKKEQERVKEKGYTFNKDGSVTGPSGTVSAETLSSGAGMLDAGLMTKDEAAAFDKRKAALAKKFKIASMGLSGGAGGGGGSMGKMPKYEYDDPFASMYGQDKAKDPTTAGLTRTLASGESIGAQQDNIFEMVRRRYQQKSEEKIFVGQEPAE